MYFSCCLPFFCLLIKCLLFDEDRILHEFAYDLKYMSHAMFQKFFINFWYRENKGCSYVIFQVIIITCKKIKVIWIYTFCKLCFRIFTRKKWTHWSIQGMELLIIWREQLKVINFLHFLHIYSSIGSLIYFVIFNQFSTNVMA